VDAHRSRPRSGAPGGRHFLSPRIAAELVDAFEIASDDVVLEIGAGSGRLTRPLCDRARLVLAVELDPGLARRLLGLDRPNLYVHRGDALEVAAPSGGYRVLGNAPFAIGTGLLRRFLDDRRATGLDLILQREVARKRARGRGSVLGVVWSVTWTIEVVREIPRRAFHPEPRVDAAWLRARRRPDPLLAPEAVPSFERFVRTVFARGSLRRAGVPTRAMEEAGLDPRTDPTRLDVERWVALYHRVGGA
jgi:23S rRNA (adenine-N6)-dimethyltransferase